MMRPAERRARSAQIGQRSNDRRGIQIGPRIRVGGSVGRVAENAKNAVVKGVKDTGHFIGDVADNKYAKGAVAAALLASGAGAGAGAAILGGMGAAGGALKRGGNLGSAVRGGVTGAATGALAGGGRSLLGKAVPAIVGGVKRAPGLLLGGGNDGKGRFGALGDMLGGGDEGDGSGGGGGLLDKILLGGAVAGSAADRMRQQKLQDRAADYATNSYDSRAPLRERGQSMALDDSTSDLSSLFSDPGNVYDRQKRAPVIGPSVPAMRRPGIGSPLRRISNSMSVPGVEVGPKVPARKLSY